MRDCYVGDIGDCAKYGLLRAIGKGKRLGVAWYLCGDPEVNNTGDGRHTAYLQRPDEWRHLDPGLFDTLKNLIDEKRRSVAEIEQSGILGGADFASEPVDVSQVSVGERESWRRAWFERVQNALFACDLVFADPDNGLYPNEKFAPTRKENAKRISLHEALELAKGRTVVIYHHNSMMRGGISKKSRTGCPDSRAAPMHGTGAAGATGRSSSLIPIPKLNIKSRISRNAGVRAERYCQLLHPLNDEVSGIVGEVQICSC